MKEFFNTGLKDILFAYEEVEKERDRWREIAGMFYSYSVRKEIVRKDVDFDKAVAAYVEEAGLIPPWEDGSE